MVALWIMVVMLSLFSAMAGALIALRLQYRMLEEGRQERDAWREAQEGRQRTWEVRQAKRNIELEKQVSHQMKDLRTEWQCWQKDWLEQARRDQQAMQIRAALEQELARLPHIEDVELPLSRHIPRQPPDRWQPPMLAQADLRGRDLSHRYMSHADLREAHLARADLYMADLTGANLAGANLEGANLAGANLCGADLRGANLCRANLLVADIHLANLQGAILLEARGLTGPQLHTAISDETTHIDSALRAALVRAPEIHATPEQTSTPLAEPVALLAPTASEATPNILLLDHSDQPEITPSIASVSTEEVQPQEHEPAMPIEAAASAQQPSAEHVCTARSSASPEQASHENEHTDTEELPSQTIIQLLTHSITVDVLSDLPKAGKAQGNNQMSALAGKPG